MADLSLPGDLGERFTRLAEVLGILRERCPWTAALTHESLLEYLVEEAYEVVEAVEAGTGGPDRAAELRGELGDVLLQVMLHSRLQQEAGGFTVADVVDGLTAKMVRRNPHVFNADGSVRGDAEASTLEAIEQAWDEAKKAESPARASPYEGIPGSLPALLLAAKSISRARRADAALPVVPDGVPDVSDAGQLGDVLLALVARAAKAGLDAETALRAAVRRYTDADGGPSAGPTAGPAGGKGTEPGPDAGSAADGDSGS